MMQKSRCPKNCCLGHFGPKNQLQQMMYLYLVIKIKWAAQNFSPKCCPETKTLRRKPNRHAETSQPYDHRPIPTYPRTMPPLPPLPRRTPDPQPPRRSFSSAKKTATTSAASADSDGFRPHSPTPSTTEDGRRLHCRLLRSISGLVTTNQPTTAERSRPL